MQPRFLCLFDCVRDSQNFSARTVAGKPWSVYRFRYSALHACQQAWLSALPQGPVTGATQTPATYSRASRSWSNTQILRLRSSGAIVEVLPVPPGCSPKNSSLSHDQQGLSSSKQTFNRARFGHGGTLNDSSILWGGQYRGGISKSAELQCDCCDFR